MLELINQLDGFDPRGNIKVNILNGEVFFGDFLWLWYERRELGGGWI